MGKRFHNSKEPAQTILRMSPLGVIFREELLISDDELLIFEGKIKSLMGLEIIREVDKKISSGRIKNLKLVKFNNVIILIKILSHY